MASSEFRYVEKGQWVFRQGSIGDVFYLLLHGKCKVLIKNKKYLETRRMIRETLKNYY